MRWHYILYLFIFTFLFTLITPAEAHNGGRDELGGHFRRADCMYLLHSPTPLAESAKNKQELIQLIKQNNTNSTCTSGLNESKLDLEGYTISSEGTSKQSTQEVRDDQPKPNATTTSKTATPLAMGKKYPATLDKCTDGDTANFNVNGQIYKTRFLYIDTPESTIEQEPFGIEASDFTCNFLKQGKITLETDGGEIFDKYDRLLAWVFVNDQLHQEAITKAGLVEDFYDYGDYKYEDRIISAMDYATSNYVGMYSQNKPKEEVEPVQKEEQ
ncbi:thermonuclease family protein [Metabacillus elymi]|nr:thermonuclease family protein [Metabacillus sp. KUDC1714]